MARARKTQAQQAGILVLGKVAAKGAESLTPFLIVRLLGKADVGALTGLMMIYSTLVIFLTAGFPKALLYFLADKEIDHRWQIVKRICAAMVGLGCGVGLMLLGLGVFGDAALSALGDWMAELVGVASEDEGKGDSVPLAYLSLLALYPLFDVPVRILPNLLIAEDRPRWAASVGVLRSIGVTLATLVPAAMGWGLQGILLGLVGFGVVHATVFALALRLIYKNAGGDAPQVRYGELLRFSFPLGVTDIVNMLNTNLDRYLILILMSAVAFAEYRMGAWQIPMITTVAYSVGTVYMPKFVELFSAGRAREAIEIWRESIGKVSLIVLPVATVFAVAAEEFVTLAFTEEYIAAAPVFRCYCLLMFGRVAAFGSVMVAAGKPGYVLRSAALTLSANAAISIPLTLWLGFIGPALGTVIAFIPTVMAYCWYIARATGLRFREIFPLWRWLKVVLTAAPGAAAAVAFKLSMGAEVGPGGALAIEALIVVSAFAVLGTLTGQITREDWRYVADWLRLKILK